MRLDSVYINYWSLRDPLTESQSLPVVRGLAAHGYRMGLVTFEQPQYALPVAAQRVVAAAFENEGIVWKPLPYHRKPAVLSTLWDAFAGLRLALALKSRSRVALFHSRGTVPAAPAAVAALLTRSRFFYDADGPLSQEYVDAGVWAEGSIPHLLTGACERFFLRVADAVAALTRHRSAALDRESGSPVTVLPCFVDTDHFRFDPAARARIRASLDLTGTVFVYAGKWGGWYASEEMFEFLAYAQRIFGRLTVLVLTHDCQERFLSAADRHGLRARIVIQRASRADMPAFLSAADVGLSFVRPLPSKLSCSPVKNGEYLACGLPVVTPPNIGDYSEMVCARRVGVVLESFQSEQYRAAAISLAALLGDSQLQERCRLAAIEEVSFSDVAFPRYVAIYERLLRSRTEPPARHGGNGASFANNLDSKGNRNARFRRIRVRAKDAERPELAGAHGRGNGNRG